MSMAFFVHRLAICDELLISMLGMLKEKPQRSLKLCGVKRELSVQHGMNSGHAF